MELVIGVKLNEFVYSLHWKLIFESSLAESREFIGAYVDRVLVILVIGLTVSGILIYQLLRRLKNSVRLKRLSGILALAAVCCMIFTSVTEMWKDCGVGRATNALMDISKFEKYDLVDSQRKFEVVSVSDIHPDNIILIIGESFDKNHSNLYGYDKITNPLLSRRAEAGALTVFPNVSASAPTTSLSMRLMFTLTDDINDAFWTTHPVLPAFLNKCGYHTIWLSNQIANSVSDNLQEQLSLICDERFFTVRDYEIYSAPDSVLFAPYAEYVDRMKHSQGNFIVVHLLGSHADYSKRYPPEFSSFREEDYPGQPQERRSTFASYDNSILYNDYCVDRLLSMADSLDAVVFYVPDHGQDFYYTRDVAAHGRLSVPESFKAGCQIPFMIYFTPGYRAAYPETVSRIRSYRDKTFETRYLMNTIMELSGFDIKGSDAYNKSLFEGNLYK